MAQINTNEAAGSGQKITPFLWFDNNAGEAMDFYVSIFKDSKILHVSHYNDVPAGPTPKVMTATIQLAGQKFMVLNGGPMFKFTPAISFFVSCEDQVEVDYFWDKLTEGGEESQCGWLKDKFGLSWQIIPSVLGSLLGNPDPAKAKRAMNAMLKMRKLNIQTLMDA